VDLVQPVLVKERERLLDRPTDIVTCVRDYRVENYRDSAVLHQVLVLSRTDVLANKRVSCHVLFKLLEKLLGFGLDILDDIEPDVSHFLCEDEAVTVVAVDVVAELGQQTHVLGADYPSFDFCVPGHLDVFSVRFESLDHLDFVTLENRLQRTGKYVVFVHVMLGLLETGVIVTGLGRDVLIA
jgi:hypothetical protein